MSHLVYNDSIANYRYSRNVFHKVSPEQEQEQQEQEQQQQQQQQQQLTNS